MNAASAERFDVCVIGAGPAGYAAAMRCWDFGKKVALVNRSRTGGAGLHAGALSSKTMWELSKDFRNVMQTNRGYTVREVDLEFCNVLKCVEDAVSTKEQQLLRQLSCLREPNPAHGGSIQLIEGAAEFIDQHRILVRPSLVEGDSKADMPDSIELSSDYFVIATGSRPRTLPNVEVDGVDILTSDSLDRLEAFPESMVIVGAGIVGCEFATIFSNFGRTKISIIDRADRILPFEDEDIAAKCSENLEEKGVIVHQKANLLELKRSSGGVSYTIEHSDGSKESFEVEKALISIGRVPNTEGLALENAGVELSERRHIVHKDGRTSVESIFAAGDVTLDVALVSIGEIEGRHVAESICAKNPPPLCFDNMSTIMFLDPEVAAIGLNEQQAQEQGISYKVARYGYSLINRAIAMRATDGFIKIIVSDDDENKILGMRALGERSSAIIEAASLLIKHGRSVLDLAELIHPHPAITEGLQECSRLFEGSSIFKPEAFPDDMMIKSWKAGS